MIQAIALYGLLMVMAVCYWLERRDNKLLQMEVYKLQYILELAQLREEMLREEEENDL